MRIAVALVLLRYLLLRLQRMHDSAGCLSVLVFDNWPPKRLRFLALQKQLLPQTALSQAEQEPAEQNQPFSSEPPFQEVLSVRKLSRSVSATSKAFLGRENSTYYRVLYNDL